MNPGKLNHRIKFTHLTNSIPDQYGDVNCIQTELLTTWGSLEPVRQYHQLGIEAGASILNGDKILVIRFRKEFTPAKDMQFEDLNTPGDIYTVHAILPYWPGTKTLFESSQATVYKDTNYVFILGTKRS